MTKIYSQGNVSVHFGPSIPISDFGSDDIEDKAAEGAATGFKIG